MFYNDLTCVEEIHEGFVALYKDSPEHHNIMVEIMAEFAQRRQNYREVCEEKNIPVHVYLSICTIAELWLTKESAVRHLGVSVPRGRSTREAATTQQRVNAVNDDLLEEVMARVAAVEQGRFREGGGVGGAPPPSQGVQRGTPTAPTALTGGLFGAARDLHPVASPFRPPSRSGSDTNETFTGKDGVKRYPGKGMPEVRINDAVEALKDAMLPRDLSIMHFNIPPGTDVNDFLSIFRFEPYLIERLWDNGNCSEEVRKALAFISPAVPYGGDGEPSRPQYCEDKKVMSRNADGSESWKEQSCLHCHHAPPWKSKDGPRPLARRCPLPSEVPADTRIRRLHLRKNAWWAWAPRHDPADDHLYGWLRLDSDVQQQLSASLASLEVPPIITEEEPPAPVENDFEPPYKAAAAGDLAASRQFSRRRGHVAGDGPRPPPL